MDDDVYTWEIRHSLRHYPSPYRQLLHIPTPPPIMYIRRRTNAREGRRGAVRDLKEINELEGGRCTKRVIETLSALTVACVPVW